MTSYPCPACRAPADLSGPCARCGWPPDPEAAEVIRLGGVIQELSLRRAALSASVTRRVAAARPAAEPAPAGAAAAPEASTLTVQNVLFILGGALLGIAAIVFTAVAWATFGVGGRAAILAGVTAAALSAPPLALRRRLRATAETFAAVGLLLVVLDGYAAWYINLLGVSGMSGATYAGLVGAVTAGVAVGYGALTRLRGPGYVALAAAPPALPLLVAGAWPGHVLVSCAVAALATAGVVRFLGLGYRIGGWVVTAAVSAVVLALTAVTAVPVPHERFVDWQVPASVVLLALAVAALAPSRRWWPVVAIAAAVPLALAVPAGRTLPWWGPSIVDLVVAAALSVAVIRFTHLAGSAALLLVGHCALAGLARSESTARVAFVAMVVLLAAVFGLRRWRPAVATYVLVALAIAAFTAAWPSAHRPAVGVLLLTATGAIGAVAAGHREARWTGWVGALAAAVSLAGVAAADLPGEGAGRWMLLVAALALAGSAVVREGAGLAAAAHAAAFVALVVTGGGAADSALVFALWGAVVGVRAVWPLRNAALAGVAAACAVAAWFLLLGAYGVRVIEAYTVPAALVALLAGWLALRHRPALRSWVAYGPGLAAGLLPSLGVALGPDALPLRRLLVGLAAVAVVAAGAARRRQAPVVIGGGVALAVALHELALVWQRLATWIPLSLAGLLLVLLAMTYERRRRELHRLRAAVTRMT